jgi:hypothetical protein
LPGRSGAPSWWRSRVADLTETPDGLRVLIRHSKTDQEGQGQEVAIPRGYRLRRVEAVQTWLAAAEISAGPVFRAVALGGRVSDEALVDDSASRIVKRYAPPRRAGCRRLQRPQPAQRVPHVGGCGGASIWKLSGVSRHNHLDTRRGRGQFVAVRSGDGSSSL